MTVIRELDLEADFEEIKEASYMYSSRVCNFLDEVDDNGKVGSLASVLDFLGDVDMCDLCEYIDEHMSELRNSLNMED